MSTRKLFSTRLRQQYKDLCTRAVERPLITPSDIKPSDPRLEVIGVLNPTFIKIQGSRHLIVRVDERPLDSLVSESTSSSHGMRPLLIAYANIQDAARVEIIEVEVPETYDPVKEPILPKSVRQVGSTIRKPELLLSYISHLRTAELSGQHVRVSETPIIFPADHFSQYGCEDPRATQLEGQSIVAYTAIGRFGATAWFAGLSNCETVQYNSMILGPDHKHVVLFPKKIGNYYYILNKPLTRSYILSCGVWLFRSLDLIHWGIPSPLLLPRPGMWDSVNVGPGTNPILTSMGWLFFYYGMDVEESYHVGAALVDQNDPTKLIARSIMPVLSPVLDWEKVGRRADTVFACGLELLNDFETIRLYYGAADTFVGAADISMSALLDILAQSM